MPRFTDKELICKDCDTDFIWEAGEQKFMNKLLQQGKVKKVLPPQRCLDCRTKKKERFEQR